MPIWSVAFPTKTSVSGRFSSVPPMPARYKFENPVFIGVAPISNLLLDSTKALACKQSQKGLPFSAQNLQTGPDA